jgi:hypothetical protein
MRSLGSAPAFAWVERMCFQNAVATYVKNIHAFQILVNLGFHPSEDRGLPRLSVPKPRRGDELHQSVGREERNQRQVNSERVVRISDDRGLEFAIKSLGSIWLVIAHVDELESLQEPPPRLQFVLLQRLVHHPHVHTLLPELRCDEVSDTLRLRVKGKDDQDEGHWRFVATTATIMTLDSLIPETKVPDATPGVIAKYALSDRWGASTGDTAMPPGG